MRYVNIFKVALNNLLTNKTRTWLTILGTMIGIASIIIVYSAGNGLSGLIMHEIDAFGTNILETEIKVPSSKKGMASEQQNASALVQGVQVTSLTLKDMADIDNLSNIVFSYPGLMDQEQIVFANKKKKALLIGTNNYFIDIDQGELVQGRFFTKAENNSLAKVVVLGYDIKNTLFGEASAIGQMIRIRHTKYRVIGVMAKRGAMLAFNWDNLLYVPIKTLQKRLMGVQHISYMIHRLKNPALADNTAEEVRNILRQNHHIFKQKNVLVADTGNDDFRVVTTAEMRKTVEVVTNALTWLLLAIVAISLLVGGVGLMNIMYVAVSERSAEIGLRKAVGANYRTIMMQFLIEAVILTFLGGLVGIIFGAIVSLFIAWGARSYGLDWDFSLPLISFVVALFYSIFFGLFFGLYPARQAAKLEPITAMRRE